MVILTPTRPAPRWHALVAEDSLVHQRLASHILSKLAIQATVVRNGREAVEAVRNFEFDLVLMDVEMPVLDGCAATRQIRAREIKLGIHLPIVAVTSLEDPSYVLSAGMDAYIRKPLSVAALDEILGRFVASTASC